MTVAGLYLPVRTKSALNAREHWSAKAKRVKAERDLVRLVWRSTGNRATREAVAGKQVVRVSFVRVGPRLLDSDNLGGALKGIRDQIADELGVSDGPHTGIEWLYSQAKGQPGEWAVAVEIEVTEISETTP